MPFVVLVGLGVDTPPVVPPFLWDTLAEQHLSPSQVYIQHLVGNLQIFHGVGAGNPGASVEGLACLGVTLGSGVVGSHDQAWAVEDNLVAQGLGDEK